MKKKSFLKSFVALGSIMLSSVITARVTEVSTISAVLPLVKSYQSQGKKVLVVFDYDNTLVRAEPLFGRLEFFTKKGEQLVSQGMALTDVQHFLYNDYTYIVHTTSDCLVEEHAPEIVQQLNNLSGVHVMGVTGRPMYVSQRTSNENTRLGITFNFPLESRMLIYLVDVTRPVLYENQTLYCDVHNSKDDVIMAFFEKISYRPDVVIMIDDSVGVINKMEKRMTKEGIIYEGLRFNRCDKDAAELDLEKAEKEFQTFKKSKKNTNQSSLEKSNL